MLKYNNFMYHKIENCLETYTIFQYNRNFNIIFSRITILLHHTVYEYFQTFQKMVKNFLQTKKELHLQ